MGGIAAMYRVFGEKGRTDKMIIEKYFGINRETAQQMITATEIMAHEKSGDNGFQSTKVFLFANYAVLKMQNMNFRNAANCASLPFKY